MKELRYTLITLVALVLVAGPLPTHAATHAAKVIYAFGQVQATSAAGKARTLRKGDQVFPGETVATRRGRAQIKFTDGGFASLQPNTEYRIDEYNYAGKPDGQERSFLSLIKGSVRLITGVIGRANRTSFRIKTKVATISIRGTSGKVSHCDSDCGDLPVGTRLQGYGGVWDLVSGSFSGPVASGDAYVCDGNSCLQMQGGVAQREDVDPFEIEELEPVPKPDGIEEVIVQQGEQIDDQGVLCDLGGNCGDTLVLLNQIGAGRHNANVSYAWISDLSRGDVGGGVDGVTVLLDANRRMPFLASPFAFILAHEDQWPFEVEHEILTILTIDIDALRTALNTFPAAVTAVEIPEVGTLGNALLDLVPAATLDNLRSMPASVASEDFGTTSDNILTFFRWTDGYVLDVSAVLKDFLLFRVDLFKLTAFQSEHFIYGPEPGPIPTSGSAVYNFTGGTFSTATDGSSIGLGVTDGQLLWDFGLGSGALDMTVVHGAMTFEVTGGLHVRTGEPQFFFEDAVFASLTSGNGKALRSGPNNLLYNPVTLDGFFAGPNNSPPLAAGLSYSIVLFSSFGYDIIGVAGFGLDSSTTASTTTTPVAASTGMYIATAHAFMDNVGNQNFGTNSNGWDLIVGSGNTATLLGDSVASFFASTGDPVCTLSCSFDAGTAVQVESGTMPSIGASWVRWAPGHSFTHSGAGVSELGDAHIVKVDAPTSPIPTSTTGIYTVDGGGTTPTWNFGTTFQEADSWTHTLTVDFAPYGVKSATHTINFPAGTVTMTGTTTAALSTMNSINNFSGTLGDLTGTTASDCIGCVYWHDHYTFGGSNAQYVVGSGQFNTSGASGQEGDFAGGFTFVLGDSAR